MLYEVYTDAEHAEIAAEALRAYHHGARFDLCEVEPNTLYENDLGWIVLMSPEEYALLDKT